MKQTSFKRTKLTLVAVLALLTLTPLIFAKTNDLEKPLSDISVATSIQKETQPLEIASAPMTVFRQQDNAPITVISKQSPDYFAQIMSAIEPVAGDSTAKIDDIPAQSIPVETIEASQDIPPVEDITIYDIEENELEVETVLVAKRNTIISSSRDGRIAKIPFYAGDIFSKGDILVEYDCSDVQAELQIAQSEKRLARKKLESGYKLFNLDVISEVDRQDFINESKKADAKARIFNTKLSQCQIRAEFDGRVTNRLANIGEYTRTDRVLMEVASLEPLQAEFLMPSRWLRWVNIGAPITLTIGETDRIYTANIIRIYGAVDPISQSIQVTAQLDNYNDPLLPGMSGQAVIDINQIRESNINGFLESTTQ